MSVQTGFCDSSYLRVGRKIAIFEFFFQSSRAQDLSAPFINIRGVDKDGVNLAVWGGGPVGNGAAKRKEN